jgi:hypothetical protein
MGKRAVATRLTLYFVFMNWPVLIHMYMHMTQKPKLELAAPIFELGWPSQAIPGGRTVTASINTLDSGKGVGKINTL